MAAPPIDPKEISVVVQGPVMGGPSAPPDERFTNLCLESIRRHLPGAEIILSTWKGSDTSKLDFDRLVESDDPGGHPFGYRYKLEMLNNINRQLVSTQAGLAHAQRKYAIKIRSDMVLTGNTFLQYFGKFKERAPEWAIVKERLLSCTVYARNPRQGFPYPFHPSDFFTFGYTEDVRDLWEVPLVSKDEIEWFRTRNRPWPAFDSENDSRYAPEQHIWLSFLRKHGTIDVCDHIYDCTDESLALSELTFANNLVLLNPSQLCVKWLKLELSKRDWYSIYSHGEWIEMYRRFCGAGAHKPVRLDPELIRKGLDAHSRGFIKGTGHALWQVITGFGYMLRLLILDFEGFRKGLDRSLPHGRLLLLNPHLINQVRYFVSYAYNVVIGIWARRLFVNAPRKLLRMARGGRNAAGSA